MSVKSVANTVVHVLKREPVAVWGVVIAAILGVLPLVGVPAVAVKSIGLAVSLLGVPVVRRRVTPLEAAEAVVVGAVKEQVK